MKSVLGSFETIAERIRNYFGWNKISIQHPVLGKIVGFPEIEEPENYDWRLAPYDFSGTVSTMRGPVAVEILAPKSRPTHQQIEFWRWIIEDLEEILNAFGDALRHSVWKVLEKKLTRDDWSEISLSGVELPAEGDLLFEWSLTLVAQSSDDEAMIIVFFHNGSPSEISIEADEGWRDFPIQNDCADQFADRLRAWQNKHETNHLSH